MIHTTHKVVLALNSPACNSYMEVVLVASASDRFENGKYIVTIIPNVNNPEVKSEFTRFSREQEAVDFALNIYKAFLI